MKAVAKLRAMGILVRKYPKATLHAASAGVWQAARIGVSDLISTVQDKRIVRFRKRYKPLKVSAIDIIRTNDRYSKVIGR